LRSTIENLDKATALLSSISEDKQREAQIQIESIVTQGLQKIFGPGWSFKLRSSIKAKVSVVDFVVQTVTEEGKVLETPAIDARGAGVASVIGFLLRLVLILLSKKESLLVLDETFANLSDSYIPRLVEFLREIVDKTNLQIVMVTHEPAFAEVADKCYKFTLDNQGMTRVDSL